MTNRVSVYSSSGDTARLTQRSQGVRGPFYLLPFTFYLLLSALLLCSCSAEDPVSLPEQSTLQLRVPISVMVSNGVTTRMGDPGVEEKMPPPGYVYILTWKKSNKTTYEFLFIRREVPADRWTLVQDEGSEYDDHYELRNAILINGLTAVDQDAGFAKNEMIGRCYAIASSVEIPVSELKTMVDGLSGCLSFALDADGQYEKKGIVEADYPVASLDANIQAMEVDCSSAAWNKEALRDLYSSPAEQDGRQDVLGIGNGLILYNAEDYDGYEELHGDVRLYHAAAKIDFKWEVPTTLQDQIAVQKITTSGLPTKCRIFQPANNNTVTPTVRYIIGSDTEENLNAALNKGGVHPINPGNKWMGREYFYALQPADGVIRYEVAFESVDGLTTKPTVSPTFDPTASGTPLNRVFTGWYRINAIIDN